MFKSNYFGSDCTTNNIMFDLIRPVKIDRKRNLKRAYTRTQRPPRYYFIGFGLSRQYRSRDAMDEPLRGGDMSQLELGLGRGCNPFHTDIYYIGNLVRLEFLEVRDRVVPDHK